MPATLLLSTPAQALRTIERLIGDGARERAIAELEALEQAAPADDLLRLWCLLLRGEAHVDGGNLDDGLTSALQAADLALQLDQPADRARALCLQSRIYLNSGLTSQAMDSAATALSLGQSLGDKALEARALLRMSTYAFDTDDEEQARQLLHRGLALAEAAGSLEDEFWALNDLSHLQGLEAARLAEAGHGALVPAAVARLQATVGRALALSARTGHWLQRAYATANLADAYIVLGQNTRARALIGDYAAMARVHGYLRLLAYANLDEARLLRSEGRLQAAIDLLSSSAHQTSLGTFSDLTLSTIEALVRLNKDMGQFEAALVQMEKLRAVEKSMMTGRAEQQLRLIMAKSDLERAREAEDRLRLEAERLAVKARMIEVERDLLRLRSRVDGLTGVGNRSAAEEDLALRLAAHGTASGAFSVAFVDVDHFKQINDQFGHDIGDRVLQNVGQLIRTALPHGDEVYRFGGDEFILVIGENCKAATKTLCEGLCQRVAAFDWAGLSPGLRVTASFGVADWRGDPQLTSFLARADAAMYQAKRDGRNQVFLDWG